jgi:dTDP-4-dehydrorhamnose reductase
MRILVTGGAGQLGSAIVAAFAGFDVESPSSSMLNITDSAAVERAVTTAKPDVIVNCAAFNNVDGAEDHPEEALALNAFAVRTLARLAEDAGATLVHFGTDFVFDGTAAAPYDETATPSPQSKYAMSKLLGERFALEVPRSYVLRVESLFGVPPSFTGRRGSMDGIVRGLEEAREIPVFTDRVVSPGYVVDIAAATRHLIESHAPAGVYHCVNDGATTWVDIAGELARLLGVAPKLRLVSSEQVSLKAARPRYSAMSTAKLAATGFVMPPWRDALRRWMAVREGASGARPA